VCEDRSPRIEKLKIRPEAWLAAKSGAEGDYRAGNEAVEIDVKMQSWGRQRDKPVRKPNLRQSARHELGAKPEHAPANRNRETRHPPRDESAERQGKRAALRRVDWPTRWLARRKWGTGLGAAARPRKLRQKEIRQRRMDRASAHRLGKINKVRNEKSSRRNKIKIKSEKHWIKSLQQNTTTRSTAIITGNMSSTNGV
jgi:hypothetical protein